jgi:hypothetical protein
MPMVDARLVSHRSTGAGQDSGGVLHDQKFGLPFNMQSTYDRMFGGGPVGEVRFLTRRMN